MSFLVCESFAFCWCLPWNRILNTLLIFSCCFSKMFMLLFSKMFECFCWVWCLFIKNHIFRYTYILFSYSFIFFLLYSSNIQHIYANIFLSNKRIKRDIKYILVWMCALHVWKAYTLSRWYLWFCMRQSCRTNCPVRVDATHINKRVYGV